MTARCGFSPSSELSSLESAFNTDSLSATVSACVPISTPIAPSDLNRRLAERGIIGGLDLGRFEEALAGHWLLCATELNDRAAIDRLIAALREI